MRAVIDTNVLVSAVREAKAKSHRKKIYLGDSEPDEHIVVFYKGRMVDIICPNRPLRSAETSKV
jgi:hypothetical protein